MAVRALRAARALIGWGCVLGAAASCSGPAADRDAAVTNVGVGGPCQMTSDCRSGLVCSPATFSCQPQANVMLGGACTLTAQCAGDAYCGPDARCDPAGDVPVDGVCTDTASCVRGAVCVRATPGLYGQCEVPHGQTADGPDGGMVTGAMGSAHDVGGSCMGALDCLAGLACDATSHLCEPAVAGMGLPALWPGVACVDESAMTPVRAYFEVPAADGTPPHDFFRLPFPNDARLDPSTHRINLTGFPTPGNGPVGFDVVDRYARASERELDGFGTNQDVYFRFSASVDFNTLALGTTIQLIDLTTGAPTGSSAYGANTGGNRYLCPNFLAVSTGSGSPMTPGHTYAVILTDGIHDSHGAPIARDADFGPMLAATAPTDARLSRAYAAYAPLRTYLEGHPVAGTVVDATVFTTQDPTRLVPALRDAVAAQPAPAAHGFVRCDTGVRSPCDDGLSGADHVRGCFAADPAFDELQGRIDVPIVQQGTRPYATPGDGAIATDAAGHVMVQGTEQVCVTVTIPHGVPMPAGGWPTVLYAHGTGGNYRSGVTEGLAAALANIDTGGGTSAHLAMVGYEGVMHGERRGAGVTDSPNVLFFNFANPEAARDNVLQGTTDVFALVRALRTIHLPMLPTPSDTTAFDPARVMFLGHSQGSTVGTAAVAYETDLRAAVLSGAGGDLRISLTTKRHPVDIASLVPLALQDPGADSGHPALQMFQAYFERADAVNFGPLLLFNTPMGAAPRPLVQTYGLGDTYSSDGTIRALATSIGLPAAAPIPGGMNAWPSGGGVALPLMNNVNTAHGAVTAVLLESDPMGAYDGHFVLFNDTALRSRVMGFFASSAAGTATVR